MDSPSPYMLQPGATLGPYKIESLIGQGGMGEVYRGIDTRLGRPVAIKVSAKEFSDRFEREARAISSLNHPNICTLYDVGPNYLVMELVEGETLSKLLKQGPLPLDKALPYAIQIADALAAAHAKGVVHRDLKPGNIILTSNGIKVLDFGLAKLSAVALAGDSNSSNIATLTEPITSKGAILGTLHYMSPEQVESKEADERSDIFSFGAVLYEMTTGQRPFTGDTSAGIMASILKEQPTPIRQVQPLAPRGLERVVAKCLEKKPSDRWHSAHDLKPALELIDLDASATSASGTQAPAPIPARRPWLWPAAAVGVLLLAGLGWTLWPSAPAASRVTRFEVPLPEGVQINPNTFHILVSPDGAKIAFTTGAGIWVRDLEAVEARLLTGTEGALSPTWSPDSRSLAYGLGRQLLRVDVAGGPPQVLAQSATAVGSGFWTKEGEIIFGGRGAGPIQKVSQAGGIPAPVTALAEGEGAHSLPSLLPDGRNFLYLAVGNLWLGSLDASPEQQPRKKIGPSQFGVTFVRSGDSNTGHLFFLRESTLMAQPFDTEKMELTGDPVPVATQVGAALSHGHYSATPSGLLAYRRGAGSGVQLTWLDRKGQNSGTLGEPGTSGRALRLSPDETQAAYFRQETPAGQDGFGPEGDLYVLDIARDIETRFTFGKSAVNLPPVWSPDGKFLAFLSRSALATVVRPASGATDAQVLAEGRSGMAPTDWSRDRRFLIGMTKGGGRLGKAPEGKSGADAKAAGKDGRGGPGGIGALPLKGTEKDGELVALLRAAGEGALSPDGRWLAYTSVESGRAEIYIQPFRPGGPSATSPGAKWQVSRDGGTEPRWRADGKEVFFLVSSPTGGVELAAAEVEAAGDALRPAAPVRLFPLPITFNWQWDVSRDGQRVLAWLPLDRGAATPITVVMNWQGALKR